MVSGRSAKLVRLPKETRWFLMFDYQRQGEKEGVVSAVAGSAAAGGGGVGGSEGCCGIGGPEGGGGI